MSLIINKNRSCVEAINKAAEIARGDILIVVSDDTDCFPGWDTALLKEVEGKEDWILKTQDGDTAVDNYFPSYGPGIL